MNRVQGEGNVGSVVGALWNNKVRALSVAAVMLVASIPAIGQGGSPDLQQKLALVKQSVAENQQRLHQYQWVESTQMTLNGDAKPASQSMCQYAPDGSVQKVPMSPPPPPPSGGRLKQRIVANKTDEMQQYMGGVKQMLGMYVPPDPQKMQQAFAAGKAALSSGGPGIANIVFTDYAQPGDKMTLSFNTATKKITSLNVNTYMDNPKDVVTLAVTFSSLPNGINYVQQTVLNATAKKLIVTTTSVNYQPLGGGQGY
jgi:hypothetical protein